jgi:hypothetical protein
MRDLLLGIAIAYFSLSPDGQKKAKQAIDNLKKRYLVTKPGKEDGDESKPAQP